MFVNRDEIIYYGSIVRQNYIKLSISVQSVILFVFEMRSYTLFRSQFGQIINFGQTFCPNRVKFFNYEKFRANHFVNIFNKVKLLNRLSKLSQIVCRQ